MIWTFILPLNSSISKNPLLVFTIIALLLYCVNTIKTDLELKNSTKKYIVFDMLTVILCICILLIAINTDTTISVDLIITIIEVAIKILKIFLSS